MSVPKRKFSLPKDLRTPLPPVPFREKDVQGNIFGISDAADIALQKRILKDLPKPTPSDRERTSANKRSTAAEPSDDLMSMMANRLRRAETELKRFKDELCKKDKEIMALKKENQSLKAAAGVGAGNGAAGRSSPLTHSEADYVFLREHNAKMRKQIKEMEGFLLEYGMVWVGDDVKKKAAIAQKMAPASLDLAAGEWNPATSIADNNAGRPKSADTPSRKHKENRERPRSAEKAMDVNSIDALLGFHMDTKLIAKNVRELNLLCESEGRRVVAGQDGVTRLQRRDHVPITLYNNGIMMYDGPLRLYSDDSAKTLVKDLMDGYFPIELKPNHPEGVPLSLTDRTWEDFTVDRFVSFQGAGRLLGKKGTEGLTPSPPDPSKPREIAHAGGRINARALVNQLPEKVVRNGRVIDIKGPIAERLGQNQGPGDKPVAAPESRANNHLPIPPQVTAELRALTEEDVNSCLQVRSADGTATYRVTLPAFATVRHVKETLGHAGIDMSKFQLRTAFPNQSYDDNDATLEQCSLVPNAALILRCIDGAA